MNFTKRGTGRVAVSAFSDLLHEVGNVGNPDDEIVARICDSGYRAAERMFSAFCDVFDRCKVEHEEVES